jgi:predicted GIY-YIG superfamily endonuclease
MMIVYWIRERQHEDIYTEGYVGITKKELKERVREHKKNKGNSIVAGKLRSSQDLVWSVIHEVETLEEALSLEHEYRPFQNTGWNLQRGGEIGVESDWYSIPENSLKHSKKTSEATRRGIATKDTTEARSERAKLIHKNKPESYKDIVKGENNPRAILTEADVRRIKYELFPRGLKNPEIAAMFGVKPYLISFIRTGKNWKYV